MKKLQDEIVTVVLSELQRAQKEHGETFNSMPEAFAVIWEEVEEVKEDMQRVITKADDIWRANRRDDVADYTVFYLCRCNSDGRRGAGSPFPLGGGSKHHEAVAERDVLHSERRLSRKSNRREDEANRDACRSA